MNLILMFWQSYAKYKNSLGLNSSTRSKTALMVSYHALVRSVQQNTAILFEVFSFPLL